MPFEQLHALFALSKVLYESGNYSLASAALKVYRKCSPSSGPEVRTVVECAFQQVKLKLLVVLDAWGVCGR